MSDNTDKPRPTESELSGHTGSSRYTQAELNAYAHGLADGWDAANFATAYGPDSHDGLTIEDKGFARSESEYAESNLRVAYYEGWAKGVERYDNDQWADGAPKTDPHRDSTGYTTWGY